MGYLGLQVFGIPWVVRVPQTTAPLLHQALQVFKHLGGQLWQTTKKFWHFKMFFQAQSVLFVLASLVLCVISEHALVLLPPASSALDLQRHEIGTENRERSTYIHHAWLSLAYISSYYSCVHIYTY